MRKFFYLFIGVVMVGWVVVSTIAQTPKQFNGELTLAVDTSHDAAGAVDGVINGQYGFHTDSQKKSWWQVDLGSVQPIDRVVIWNRTEVASERAQTLRVLISSNGKKWKAIYRNNGKTFGGKADNKPLTVSCSSQVARFVRLQLTETNYLHLDEVQVFGVKDNNRNLALGQPCRQSSISQWSRRSDTVVQTKIDPVALRLAIEDLMRQFGDQYPNGTDYLKRLKLAENINDQKSLIALQRQALLANPLLSFDKILFVRRSANASALGLPANWQGNCSLPRKGYDDALMTLSISTGKLTTLHHPGKKFIGDVDLHFDAKRLMFSSTDAHNRWRVFEIKTDGSGLRKIQQIEESDVDNYDPVYLPDGGILFASTATFVGVPCVYGSTNVANFYRLEPATGAIRRLTFDQEHNWCPTVMNDGRVLYLRWEYTDLAHPNSRILFSMNPDGTNQMEFYGSNSYFPNSFFYARPLPGQSGQVIGVASGHHGTRRSGRLLILEPSRGRREAGGAVREIPGRNKTVEAIVRDRLVDGVWPHFLHPYPLSDKYFLVTAKPSPKSHWGIYLVDVFDNMVLLKEIPNYALLEPLPLLSRQTPPVFASRIDLKKKNAEVYMVDIYHGGGLEGVPRGTVKQLRLLTYYYGSRGMGGLLGSIGMDGPWDMKRVLGTVPVEEDGSAHFNIPANTPIAVQPLDAEGKSLQLMRSWFVGMPGEKVSCVGCHENQNQSTANIPAKAFSRKPSTIQPWQGPERGFSFTREVQPVLDRHCVSCHDGSQPANAPDLRGNVMIKNWSSQIAGNAGNRSGGKFSIAYANLHRYVRRPGIESDLHMLSPMDFHADTTELIQILRKGHQGVKLNAQAWDRLVTWIDLNAPYYGTWSEMIGSKKVEPVMQRRRALLKRYADRDTNYEAIISSSPLNLMPRVTQKPLKNKNVPLKLTHWPFDSDQAKLRQAKVGKPASLSVDLGDDVKLELMRIPAGRFAMGSQTGHPDERPQSAVTIDQPYWMGQLEVTNAQFARFDPTHDSRLESRHGYQFGRLGYALNQPDQPVVRVSWQQAMAYCQWLSSRTGKHFTLPTEAQWEYACRAGTATPFHFGTQKTDYRKMANLGDQRLKEYAACTAHQSYTSARVLPNPNPYDDWVPHDNRWDDGYFVSAPVGLFGANPWQLHDMHGNVWEWTLSNEKAYPYRADDGRNDLSPAKRKIVRGGSWYDRPKRCTSSYRLSYQPYHRVFNVGFRVVCLDNPTKTATSIGKSQR